MCHGCNYVLYLVTFILLAIFSLLAHAEALPDKVTCHLKLKNSEIASCKGVSKDFNAILEDRVENPVRHLQHHVSHNKKGYVFSYSKKATSYRDTRRPIYYYSSEQKIDGETMNLLLIGKKNIQIDDAHSNWKKDGTFFQCQGDCPFQEATSP